MSLPSVALVLVLADPAAPPPVTGTAPAAQPPAEAQTPAAESTHEPDAATAPEPAAALVTPPTAANEENATTPIPGALVPRVPNADKFPPAVEPELGLGLNEIQVTDRDRRYNFKARSWRDTVRNDPHLLSLHRRSKLLVPGGIALGVSAAWLTLSVAVSVEENDCSDYCYDRGSNAVSTVFRWVFPSALLVTGAAFTATGIKARRDLEREHRKLVVAPLASRGMGGIGVAGTF